MKVRELKDFLETMDEDLDILVARDEEGNGFAHLSQPQLSTYSGGTGAMDVGIYELTEDMRQKGYTEEDIQELPCLVLWP